MARIEGGCLCGSLRYSADAEPALVLACYCRDCQKSSGGGSSMNVAVAAEALHVQGALKEYHAIGATGLPLTRMFCPECGSQVMTNVDALRDLTLLKAGTLDDASWVKPAMHIWCSSAQPWDQPPADSTCFPQNPPL